MALAENRSFALSITLHACALLFAAFGLPALLPEPTEPTPLVMSVEVLPVSEISNVKPSDTPIQQEQKAPTPKTPKPVEPSAKAPPKPPEPKPVEKQKTPPEPEKHFDPDEGAEKAPADKPKPEEKKPDAKKPEPTKTKTDDFAALLNQLKQEAKTDKSKDAKDKTNTAENKTKSDAPYDDSLPLSISEKDAIRSQFIPCWRVPAGAKDAHSLAVRVKIELQADGTVLSAALAPDQQGRYNSDTYFRAAADSALRAVQRCSPLKGLPPEKYNSWRNAELNFDPAEML